MMQANNDDERIRNMTREEVLMKFKAAKARYAAEAGAKHTARGMAARSEVCSININLDDLARAGDASWYGWITGFSDTDEGECRPLSLPGDEIRPSAHTRQQLLKYLNHVARELGFKHGQVRDHSSRTARFDVLGVVNL
jgi:hypothetical protein